ncbi:MAG TPA: hypothetical protein VK395_21030 [Gemmataceae bacterium]|nr:hypothetical protein [Gemmataceae bacterium]
MTVKCLTFLISSIASFLVACAALAQGVSESPKETTEQRRGFSIPSTWTRRGVVLERARDGVGSSVCGDPYIVWDEAIQGWRMVLFYSPPGHGQAVCLQRDDLGPGQWKFAGPLPVANPQAVGGFHKPFIVMDPDQPNQAAKIEGRYCLLVVSFKDGHKQVQRAWSEKLAGPWTFEPEGLIPPGAADDFDAKHTDAVTGYYFPKRHEFLYFYMGYPAKRQARKISPFGSAQAVATQKLGDKRATRCGVVLEPCQQAGHWASGWVGGLQLLRGNEHRWVAIVNASPTAPDPGKKAVWTEEPPPSLGGFAWCDEEWPVRGWHFSLTPIEWVKDIPKAALDAGEGYNLWRQFIHVLPDGRAALFYNSGYYGREQLYMKVSVKP